MIYIDLPADLNAEDDDGRNIALVSDALDRRAVHPGAVLVAARRRSGRGPSWMRSRTTSHDYVRSAAARPRPAQRLSHRLPTSA
jgi:hypothetical protein